jgi:carbamoyltransferase
MGTEIEVLAVANCFFRKEDQPAALRERYETEFALD